EFVQEPMQAKAFQLVNENNYRKNLNVVKLMATFGPFLEFVIGISYVITLVYGGYLTLHGSITLGRFVAFTQYLGMLVWPMIAFGDAITSLAQGRAALSRIRHIFDQEAEIKDEDVDDVKELKGGIELKDVTFAYSNDGPEVLSDIQLKIEPGQTLAILGRTGAGKTTLVNLLLRLYDVSKGKILFDGRDIKKIPLSILREQIAYVPQDNFLFSDTLKKNIKFGKQDASDEEMIDACIAASIHDNIMEFPMKYETMVGERGVTLSGGQKQRSSIARALLKKAPILILDDALSAVDTDTEGQILGHLKQMRSNLTTIMIAHRISTVQNADYIVVLDEGKVVEYGTHDELMKANGIFKSMYDKQQLEKELQEA
ncbi:MAG: ABC transporter ATP-binding protein, partial [Erysipelotrichaceae bacterium]|nr:ABC transporter ATP-binding protein [Erysipelotrichaceae bacterium]